MSERPPALAVTRESLPAALTALPQWVLWRHDRRDGEWAKTPYRPDGRSRARSNDPSTWGAFADVWGRHEQGGFDGVGFVLTPPFLGVDLDGCRDASGRLTRHAQRVLACCGSYAEVSPSGRGVKAVLLGEKPPGAPCVFRGPGGAPRVEVYAQGRFFCLTGRRLCWLPADVRRGAAAALYRRRFLVPAPPPARPRREGPTCWLRRGSAAAELRAARYLGRLDGAVSGCGGHNATFHAACVLVHGFGLARGQALALLAEYNRRCKPPWSRRELEHKIDQALERGAHRDLLGV